MFLTVYADVGMASSSVNIGAWIDTLLGAASSRGRRRFWTVTGVILSLAFLPKGIRALVI